MTKVVILTAYGQAIPAYFGTEEEAFNEIERWVADQIAVMDKGSEAVQNRMLTLKDKDGRIGVAVMSRYIIAMYFAVDSPRPSDDRHSQAVEKLADAIEREAKVIERRAREGDEWRDE